MFSVLVVSVEEGLGFFYEEELKDFGLDVLSVDNLEKAISILNDQQFDLILLYPALWDEQELKELLGKIKLLRSTGKNTKILAMGRYGDEDCSWFADAYIVASAGTEWLLTVCDLLGIDRQRFLDHYEAGVKLMSGRSVRVGRRHIKVFVCYAREDFEQAHLVYQRLNNKGYSPWMDKENIVGGQDWELEITRAIEQSNFFLACLSKHSVSKEGYVQKELKMGLEILDRQPPGNIYLIPVRLDDCVVPQRFKRLHWINLFELNGMEELLTAIEKGCRQRGML